MPTIAKSGEIAPSRFRCAIAGASRRRVRSPEAPKITSVHGGRISSSERRVVPDAGTPGELMRGGLRDTPEARSRDPHRLLLLLDGLEKTVVGVRELLDALVLELLDDLAEVDLEVRQGPKGGAGSLEIV